MQYVKSKTVVIHGSNDKLSNSHIAIKNSNTSLKKGLHTDLEGKRSIRDDASDEDRQTSENPPRLKSSLKKKKSSFDGSTLEQVSFKREDVEGDPLEVSSSDASEKPVNEATSKMGVILEEGENEGDESSVNDDINSDDPDTDGNSGDSNTDRSGNSSEKESVDKPKRLVKSGIKKVSVFQRLATTHTLSSSNRHVSPKLKKLHTENFQGDLKSGGPKKAFSMRVDKNVVYSSFSPYNKARKINVERKLNMMRAKTQILKIAERLMSTDKIKPFQMVGEQNIQSFGKSGKPLSEKVQILSSSLSTRGEEKLTKFGKLENSQGKTPREIQTSIRRSSTKHGHLGNANHHQGFYETAAKWSGHIEAKKKNAPILRKDKKMVLRKMTSQKGLPLFENMLAVSLSGEVYSWDGYDWKRINILYESFVSLCTDKEGHIICINRNFNLGFLMSNRCFQKIDTHRETLFLKMAISGRNKMWAINLRGDLQKWNKYEWVQERKAYGIAKLKSLAFDRNGHLWVLDEKNYFYIFNTQRKNWMLHSDSSRGGGNIDDFDFNESNFLVALASDGMIKICKNGRWVKCGILGQMKITSLHFLRNVGGDHLPVGIKK
ncbi:conserved Plasmodium protein, unknown function [Plasmodium knowlesi strain H]|uniref:Thioredoxin-like associated protein 2 n=3 Tax=Plasmodium knowlesi TaxID=5850 RepID=A0A5K1VM19_PLAKH|nr:conserved Plasmodium protein, unknown function [Plasmodium knowlesi strain H]OTN67221.1 Uncharacterized protein PKNOH_S07454100 [Plasmodium knowlesi]CAA9988667.1 conserved Plasmodium protein, unknown function [Plasmodium knowlesi strain H]SBO21559.1 conserved Plasmodium protein, unknown function [Plasmodium knowlesi strain H]SBO21941.1 conserved Plasmodium protein, unknown function [Plasmodium knowlesi strain H]VVS78141.1 conserved Plasmodium protein, unknown function [Plasmodium knowlesi s|eukprot:XP_002259644.1 hypothetical protein, conserved in Plasmodium species [Plasmodium knowlesi strain H]